jgi:hypothetical protein
MPDTQGTIAPTGNPVIDAIGSVTGFLGNTFDYAAGVFSSVEEKLAAAAIALQNSRKPPQQAPATPPPQTLTNPARFQQFALYGALGVVTLLGVYLIFKKVK